jgi:hypothetical protein
MAVRKDMQNQSKWHALPPEVKAKKLAQARAWQKANPDKVKAIQERAKAKRRSGTSRVGYGNFDRVRKYEHVRDKKIERGQCVDCEFPCNETTHVCFAWDHTNPHDKLFSLSKAHKYTWEQIDQEIAKCELVCHNCHALRTYLEGHNRTERRQPNDDQPSLFD